jgi:hypothetical protein
MQREELPDSRNRQAAGTKGRQNEDQIWQRDLCRLGELASLRAAEDTVICTFTVTGSEPATVEAS